MATKTKNQLTDIAKKFATEKFALAGKKNHFLDVFRILQNEFKITNQDLLIAGILHDTLEDTATTYKELEINFSKKVASLVKEISHPKNYTPRQREKYYERLNKISDEAKQIKMADFASNLRFFIGVYERKEQRLYPQFANNDKYIKSIREFLTSCKDESKSKKIVYDLTSKLEGLI
ncbi:HD domain-containing protein [Patescibacteria group bacterium]|nr:HD domain-containing protein [Patescibacteria group bacterium]